MLVLLLLADQPWTLSTWRCLNKTTANVPLAGSGSKGFAFNNSLNAHNHVLN